MGTGVRKIKWMNKNLALNQDLPLNLFPALADSKYLLKIILQISYGNWYALLAIEPTKICYKSCNVKINHEALPSLHD